MQQTGNDRNDDARIDLAIVEPRRWLALTAAPALAQSATKIGQHNAWGTYSYQAQNGKVCYVLTVPTDKQPTDLDHGDIFFFVSQKPGQNVSFEPQFIASYNFQEKSKVVGDRRQQVVLDVHPRQVGLGGERRRGAAADRRHEGRPDMKVAAKSGRGNPTSYVFSLKGISAALDSIASCK